MNICLENVDKQRNQKVAGIILCEVSQKWRP